MDSAAGGRFQATYNASGKGVINPAPTGINDGVCASVGAQFNSPCPPLGEIVRSVKAITTRLIRARGHTAFRWQRSYYERVVRNENELNAMRQYILDNPFRWDEDPDNPGA